MTERGGHPFVSGNRLSVSVLEICREFGLVYACRTVTCLNEWRSEDWAASLSYS